MLHAGTKAHADAIFKGTRVCVNQAIHMRPDNIVCVAQLR